MEKVKKKKQPNHSRQGNIGLGAAIEYFSRNYIVSIPLNDCQPYDLIVEKDGITQKVQVKTCSKKTSKKDRKQQTYHVTDENKNYDLLFVLLSDGRKFLIPRGSVPNAKSINITKKYDKFLIEEKKGFVYGKPT